MFNMSNTLCSRHIANLLTSDAHLHYVTHVMHLQSVVQSVAHKHSQATACKYQHAANSSNSMQHIQVIACSTCKQQHASTRPAAQETLQHMQTRDTAAHASNSVQEPACSTVKQQHANSSMQHTQAIACSTCKQQHANTSMQQIQAIACSTCKQ